MKEAKGLIRSLRKQYVDVQKLNSHTAKDKEAMAKYMRNKFIFFGFKKPLRLTVDKRVVEENESRLQDRVFLLQLLPLLWEQDEREFQYFGTDLAKRFKKELLGETEAEFNEAIDCIHQLIITRSWWDTVDMLATGVIGHFVKQRLRLGILVMDKWKIDDNLWLRRTAILHQLSYKAETNEAWLFACCKLRAHETEFFIQKAIGWSLREYARTNPVAVKKFVKQNKKKLSNLSIREATKHLLVTSHIIYNQQ